MSFLSPLWLLALLPVAGLAIGYVVAQRRRHRYAVRFASLPMLETVVPRRPGWRRHLPAGVVLFAMTVFGLAAARPEMTVRVPYEQATIMVAIDTSGSMAATDVAPTRLAAAKQAASVFVGQLPDTMNVGVVSFSGSSAVVAAPTTDHAQVQRQIATLSEGAGGTAIGDAVFAAMDQVRQVTGETAGEEVPARLVLLSDGANTAGRSPADAAAAATAANMPVSTIAYGTAGGTIPGGRAVPVDPTTLQVLAQTTGGAAYTAESGEELQDVYQDIGSSIGWRTEQREVTAYVTAFGLLLALVAGALSLRWFSRII
jgi:Ca-activated chloride channel homolog